MNLQTLSRPIPWIIAALLLSACGAAASAQTYVQEHTACLTDHYAMPQWSADGGQIFYTRGEAGVNAIRAMTSLGRDDHEVVPHAVHPSLSPDGRWLLFFRTSINGGLGSIYGLIDLKTGKERVLGALGDRPVWSPDGKWITYPPWNGPSIVTMDPATSRTVTLTQPQPGQHAGDVYPLWSPDGKRVAFSSTRDGGPAVYMMDTGGGDITRLTAPGATCPGGDAAFVRPVAWQPDGQALAYGLTCGQEVVLEMVTVEGAPVTGRDYLDRSVASAQWSSDGKYMLLFEDSLGQAAINVAPADGSGIKTLRTASSDPQWSPDGRQIVFVATDQGGLDQIYTIAPDGSGLAQLTSNPGAGKMCLH